MSLGLAEVIIIILALIGFADSWYIYYKKTKKEKLVCILGDDCSKVINSKYSNILGMDNTVLGMLYYTFLIYIFWISNFNNFFNILLYSNILLVITGLAGSISLYLIYVQVYVLKDLCEYCLISAVINILIFIIFASLSFI